MNREKIFNDIEKIQNKIESKGFKGGNEHDLFLREEITDYVVKLFTIPDVSKQRELLIGLLTMLEKEGGNEFIDKAVIVAKYEANL